MSTPLVSIIVSFYNEEHLLPRCLQSLAAQSYPNLELILIDDGSTDASPEIAQQYCNTHPQTKLVHINNSGHAAARNEGLKLASGEYLSFLDADDELEPEMLALMLENMNQNEVDLAVCRFSIINTKGEQELIGGWKDGIEQRKSGPELVAEMFNYSIAESVWAKLFRRSLAQRLSFESGLWFDDRPFFLEYLCIAGKVAFVDKSLLKIHKRDASITRRAVEPKRLNDAEKVYQLEQKIVRQYHLDSPKMLLQIKKHFLQVLLDNYLLMLLDKHRMKETKASRETYTSIINRFAREKKQSLGLKKEILMRLLQIHQLLGWSIANKLISNMKKARLQQIKKLK